MRFYLLTSSILNWCQVYKIKCLLVKFLAKRKMCVIRDKILQVGYGCWLGGFWVLPDKNLELVFLKDYRTVQVM